MIILKKKKVTNTVNKLTFWLFLYNLYLHIVICFELTLKLAEFLRKGTWTWIHMLSRLLMFTAILTPGWIRLVTYWLFDSHVIRNLPYSNKSITSRNFLDIYLPSDMKIKSLSQINLNKSYNDTDNTQLMSKKYPVIVFVCGGAWIIGYKMWSALIARSLSGLGQSIVVCPDYRNAPQGDIECMQDDISSCLKWTIDNIEYYGGDKDNIILAGQSAGAHIIMSLLIDTYDRLIWNSDSNINFENTDGILIDKLSPKLTCSDLEKIKLVIGVSGPYNLQVLQSHLHKRGLDTSIVNWICNDDVVKYSPTLRLQKINDQLKQRTPLHSHVIRQFPKVGLFHGTFDASVPCIVSEECAKTLEDNGIDVSLYKYDGFSHTDLILEGPMIGDNRVLFDIIDLIERHVYGRPSKLHSLRDNTMTNEIQPQSDATEVERHQKNIDKYSKPLAPVWLVKIARKFNPF